MAVQLMIPQGDRVMTVELTVKEAMALAGYRFNQDTGLSAGAKRKLKHAVEAALLQQEEPPLHYEAIAH